MNKCVIAIINASLLLLKCLLRHSRVLVGAGQYTRGPRVTHGTLHARTSIKPRGSLSGSLRGIHAFRGVGNT